MFSIKVIAGASFLPVFMIIIGIDHSMQMMRE